MRKQEINKKSKTENTKTRQECEERAREQQAKAREEKEYQLLSNQQRKEK
ncbi:hypothetical protein [Companilactobacillus furfuricola]|nr:hypothetical protein [Companilactobacillus furfuricola]